MRRLIVVTLLALVLAAACEPVDDVIIVTATPEATAASDA